MAAERHPLRFHCGLVDIVGGDVANDISWQVHSASLKNLVDEQYQPQHLLSAYGSAQICSDNIDFFETLHQSYKLLLLPFHAGPLTMHLSLRQQCHDHSDAARRSILPGYRIVVVVAAVAVVAAGVGVPDYFWRDVAAVNVSAAEETSGPASRIPDQFYGITSQEFSKMRDACWH